MCYHIRTSISNCSELGDRWGLVAELTPLPLSSWMGRSWSSAVLWWSPELSLSPLRGFFCLFWQLNESNLMGEWRRNCSLRTVLNMQNYLAHLCFSWSKWAFLKLLFFRTSSCNIYQWYWDFKCIFLPSTHLLLVCLVPSGKDIIESLFGFFNYFFAKSLAENFATHNTNIQT